MHENLIKSQYLLRYLIKVIQKTIAYIYLKKKTVGLQTDKRITVIINLYILYIYIYIYIYTIVLLNNFKSKCNTLQRPRRSSSYN